MNFKEYKNIAVPDMKYHTGRKKTQLHLFYVKYFIIEPAVPISYILNKFRFSANAVSILRVITSFLSIPLFYLGYEYAYLGLLVLHFSQVSDAVDGQLARVQKTDSIEGAFVDAVTSYPIIPSAYLGIGLLTYHLSNLPIGLILSFLLIAYSNISGITRNSIILKIVLKRLTTISIKEEEFQAQNDKLKAKKNNELIKKKKSLVKKIKYLMMEELFLIPRFFIIICLAQFTALKEYAIYIYLLIVLYFVLRKEAYGAYKIYKKKLIIKDIIVANKFKNE